MTVNRSLLFAGLIFSSGLLPAQQSAPEPAGGIIRTETRLVVIDTVVTNKKGAYVRDLKAKNFRVYEDKKEQPIKSFSFEANSADAANAQPRYIVLLFDNSTLTGPEQTQARQAAAKFIESNAGPKRMMSIVNFGGSLQITQNFTDDAARLKEAVAGTQGSGVSPNANSSAANGPLNKAAAAFGARDMILSLRALAKNLSAVPGRKTLILFSAGFPVTNEQNSEVATTVDTSNKSNVAIYPIDIRGLAMVASPASRGAESQAADTGLDPSIDGVGPRPAVNRQGTGDMDPAIIGNRGNASRNPVNQLGNGDRRVLQGPNVNEQLMLMLADGTGGFVIYQMNDLPGGLEKIGKEMNEYYVLGYAPAEWEDGQCHTVRVKVDRGDAVVRARSGYCSAKPRDVLAGNPIEKQLETRASASGSGNVAASMQAPYFYTPENVARVDVALEIAPDNIKFEKIKGKFHAAVNVLGVAYKPEGEVGARFSDTVKLDFDTQKDVDAFHDHLFRYENQFNVTPGQYTLKVVFSAGGDNFGKLEAPLSVDAYDTHQFNMSALAFSKDIHLPGDRGSGLDAALMEDRTPLIVQGLQMIPAASNRFKKTDPAAVYLEIYEPLMVAPPDPKKPLDVLIKVRVLDVKTGGEAVNAVLLRVPLPERTGNSTIPHGLKVPVDQLAPGSYRLEVTAMDGVAKPVTRSGDFQVD